MRKLGWLLLVATAGALLAVTAAFVHRDQQAPHVAVGVRLEYQADGTAVQLGGLTEPEVAAQLAQLASQWRRQPVADSIDPVTEGLIPGVCGWELAVAETCQRVMAAPPNSVLIPCFRLLYSDPLEQSARRPIYQGNPVKRQIALVINVAWGNENLPEMLAILDREQVRASFFLVGRWAAQNHDLVQQIAAAGHEFGNHAYSDPHLPQLTRAAITEEISRTSAVITEVTGQSVRYFSPPYNDFSQTVLDTAADLGYQTVLCSLDTADWMRPGVQRIVQRIVPKAHNGAIVLMHPTEQTPAALAQIIAGLKAAGYQLVTVSELLAPASGIPGLPEERV